MYRICLLLLMGCGSLTDPGSPNLHEAVPCRSLVLVDTLFVEHTWVDWAVIGEPTVVKIDTIVHQTHVQLCGET